MKRVWLIGALCLMGALMACDSPKSNEELKDRASVAIQGGDLKAAVIDLKELIQRDSQNGELRAMLGEVYLRTGNLAAAEVELRKAVDLSPDLDGVLPDFAEALSQLGKFDEVLDLHPNFNMSAESTARLHALRARAHMALGNTTSAADELADALSVAPSVTEVQTTQAAMKAQVDMAAAQELLSEIVKAEPGYLPAWELKGRVEAVLGNFDAAEAAYTEVIRLGGDSFYLHRAMVRLQKGDLDATKADLNRAKKIIGTHYEIDFIRGVLAFKEGRVDEARSFIEAANGANKYFLPAVLYLAEINLNLGNEIQAEAYIDEYLSSNPSYLPAIILKAKIWNKFGKYDDNIEFILKTLKSDNVPDDGSRSALNALLADAYRGAGQTDKELSILSQLQEGSPSEHVNLRIGLSKLANAKPDEGRRILKDYLKNNPADFLAAKSLVESYVNTGENDEAMNIATQFQDQSPEFFGGGLLIGLIHVAAGDLSAAKTELENAKALSPGEPVINFNLAAVAVKQDQFDLAKQYLDDVLSEQPGHLEATLKLAALDRRQGNTEKMLERLKQASIVHSGSALPKLALAQHYMDSEDYRAAVELLDPLYTSGARDAKLLALLGKVMLKQGDYREATTYFQQWSNLEQGNPNAHFWLAQSMGLSGSLESAKEALAVAVELDPGYVAAHLNLAQVYLRSKDFDNAQKQLQVLKNLVPADSLDLVYFEADLARYQGRSSDALSQYRRAFELSESPKAALALAQQLWDMGSRDEAFEVIGEWLKQHPEDQSVKAYRANLYSRSGMDAKAIEAYKSLIKMHPNNVFALNNLAWLLKDSDLKVALAFSKRAYELQPEALDVGDTYTNLLLQDGQVDEALKVSEALLGGLKPSKANSEAFMSRAKVLKAASRREEARRVLQQLLDSVSDFSKRSEAAALLKAL